MLKNLSGAMADEIKEDSTGAVFLFIATISLLRMALDQSCFNLKIASLQ